MPDQPRCPICDSLYYPVIREGYVACSKCDLIWTSGVLEAGFDRRILMAAAMTRKLAGKRLVWKSDCQRIESDV